MASFPADDHLLCFVLHLSAHASIFFKSHWRLSAHMILSHVFLMTILNVELSANKWMSFSRCETKSSINVRKSTRPRILPWGTPADIGFADYIEPSSTTDCCLSDRKDATEQCKSPWIPLCYTRSYAFLMSRAITLISCWVSSALFHH